MPGLPDDGAYASFAANPLNLEPSRQRSERSIRIHTRAPRRRTKKYSVSSDAPLLEDGLRFYRDALGLTEVARPVPTYVLLGCGDSTIGLIEKQAGTKPAKGSDDVRRYGRHWTPVHIDFHVDDLDAVLAKAVAAGATCAQQFAGGPHPPAAFCNGFCLIGARGSGPSA